MRLQFALILPTACALVLLLPLTGCRKVEHGGRAPAADLEMAEVSISPCAGCRDVRVRGRPDLRVHLHRIDTIKATDFDSVTCSGPAADGSSTLTLTFAKESQAKVARWTAARIGRQVAIVANGTAWSVATISGEFSTRTQTVCANDQACRAFCANATSR